MDEVCSVNAVFAAVPLSLHRNVGVGFGWTLVLFLWVVFRPGDGGGGGCFRIGGGIPQQR